MDEQNLSEFDKIRDVSQEAATCSQNVGKSIENVRDQQWPSSSQSASEPLDENEQIDICRVCRSVGDSDLYYPCLCTGSIKYVHQDCLLEWLKYSKKEVCELCSHKYSFRPIYRTDMPPTLPVSEIIRGILVNSSRVLRSWAVYSLVLVAWLGVVPLTTCRIYRAVFSASVAGMLSLPSQMFSLDNLLADCLKGGFIVSIFLCTFISLIWLREQIVHGGALEWLNLEGVEAGDLNGVHDAVDDDGNNIPPENAVVMVEEQDNEAQENRGAAVNANDAVVVEEGEGENWRGWDRVADELTWQRLLGLDGSLLFLEHVLWVIALNTLFTVLFAFSPYQLGHLLLYFMGLSSKISYFPTMTAALMGYIVISIIIRILHLSAKIFRQAPMYRLLGMCYLVLKVFLLVLIEIGFFPVICGCWLDVCSLPLFASTLSRRIQSFTFSPSSSLFLHWLIGMVYVFYSTSFVLVLREVLRPGVLWFLRNLNDPDFNPIQEMIDLPVLHHLRRFVASILLFFTTIIFVVYVPLSIINRLLPSILPFNLSLAGEAPLSELSIELLILQVVLPAVLEHTHARSILKTIVHTWCSIVGRLLSLKNYLLPEDEARAAAPIRNPEPLAQGLAAQHQALLHVHEPQGFQNYPKPPYFPLRIFLLLVALSCTSVASSILFCVIPVSIGRLLVYKVSGHTNVHELYTVAAGLYSCWLLLKALLLLVDYIPKGFQFLFSAVHTSLQTLFKILIVAIPILFVIPLLTGISFHLAVISPIRVASYQSSLLFPWQHWAMGILHCKIFCAAVMMGPQWWMKQIFERLYADGIRGLRIGFLYSQLVAPVVACLAIHLSAPYVICSIITKIAEVSDVEQVLFIRYCYPALILCVACVQFIFWQCSKLRALAQKIRNEKYLVGTQLVNYERC